MKPLRLILSIGILLAAGCAKQEVTQEVTRWEEVQFKVCLRSEAHKEGDTMASGDFEDLAVISLVIPIKSGPGEAHAVQDGVWVHVAWDDVRVEENRPPHFILGDPRLVFDGFRRFVENSFRSPYGVVWSSNVRGNDWGNRRIFHISEEWEFILTPVHIDPTMRDPRIWCRMWRWVRNSPKPDIPLGQKREREQPDAELQSEGAPSD